MSVSIDSSINRHYYPSSQYPTAESIPLKLGGLSVRNVQFLKGNPKYDFKGDVDKFTFGAPYRDSTSHPNLPYECTFSAPEYNWGTFVQPHPGNKHETLGGQNGNFIAISGDYVGEIYPGSASQVGELRGLEPFRAFAGGGNDWIKFVYPISWRAAFPAIAGMVGNALDADVAPTLQLVSGNGALNYADNSLADNTVSVRINEGAWITAYANKVGLLTSNQVPALWGWNLFEARNFDSFGAKIYKWQWVYINQPPRASFTWRDLYAETENEEDEGKIELDASSSTDDELGQVVKYTWFPQGKLGGYFHSTDSVVIQNYGLSSEEEREFEVSLLVEDDQGAHSKYATQTVTLNPPQGDQIGAIQHPGGFFIAATAERDGTNRRVEIKRRNDATSANTVLKTFANSDRPTLWLAMRKGKPTNALLLLLHNRDAKTWDLHRSLDGGRNWEKLASPFSDPSIKYAHATGLPDGGAVACGVQKGANGAPNRLLFKRATDVANWPADGDAKEVSAPNLKVEPHQLILDARGGITLTLTNAKERWLTSRNYGRNWE